MKNLKYFIAAGIIIIIIVQFFRTPTGLAAVISPVAWPGAICFSIFLFRTEIKGLLSRLVLVKTGPFSLETLRNNTKISDVDRAAASKIDPSKPTNIYWLGSDLAQFIFKVQGADKDSILFSIQHAVHHLKQIGLFESSAYRRLNVICEEIEKTDSSNLISAKRISWANAAYSILNEIGGMLKETQPNFDGG